VTSRVSQRESWIIHNTGDGSRFSYDLLWQLPSLKVCTGVSTSPMPLNFFIYFYAAFVLTFVLVSPILCFDASNVLHCFTFRLFIAKSLCLFPNFANCWAASPLPLSEVPDSNRGPKIAIIGVLRFCLEPTDKFGNSIWNQEKIASFHILPNSLFHNRSVTSANHSSQLV
jgi:hypothetical protein